ncbi:MAG: ribosome maturation factor RimM [Ndongobacter sp.]|nr:ribosome maturation factor RimM [Ndongobacter sp.]
MTDIRIATILAPHGLRGSVKVRVEDENAERFQRGRVLRLSVTHQPVTVSSYRSQGLTGILTLEEFHSIDEVELLRGQELVASEEELPELEEGRYYVKDLIGLSVYDVSGTILGCVQDVLSYASNDVYVVKTPGGKEALLPALRSVVEKIDLENGQMTVRPMKGLFDED